MDTGYFSRVRHVFCFISKPKMLTAFMLQSLLIVAKKRNVSRRCLLYYGLIAAVLGSRFSYEFPNLRIFFFEKFSRQVVIIALLRGSSRTSRAQDALVLITRLRRFLHRRVWSANRSIAWEFAHFSGHLPILPVFLVESDCTWVYVGVCMCLRRRSTECLRNVPENVFDTHIAVPLRLQCSTLHLQILVR